MGRTGRAAASVSLLALVLAGGAVAQLECDRRVCVEAAAGETLELSCGGNGDVISSVRFASLGQPSGACPALSDDFFELDDAEAGLNATACSDDGFEAAVKAACLDETECDVAVGASVGGAGAASCNATAPLRAVVLVECSAPGGVNVFDVAIRLVVALISLGMGATVEVDALRAVFRSEKRALLLGMFCQFGCLPAISFGFVKIFDMDPLVSIGVMIIGSCPGGNSSNLVTYFSKGNVALSITMSAFSTLLSLAMLPLLLHIYVVSALGLDEELTVPFVNIFTTLLLAILPAALGVYIRRRSKSVARKVELVGSSLGALFILGAIVLGAIENPDLINFSVYSDVWISAVLLLPLGVLVGYSLAYLSGFAGPERRAISVEVGVQNTIVALAICSLSFEGCDRVEVLTYPLVASLMDPFNSVWIAGLLRFSARYDAVSDEDQDADAPGAVRDGKPVVSASASL